MKREEIKAELQNIFKDIFNLKEPLVETIVAKDVPDWDSLNHIRLMMTIQKKMSVHFTTLELTAFKNIGELISLIERKKVK